MTKPKAKRKTQLLRWTKNVPAQEVQDPLGLGLRGSTRLAGRLLFCITSITPRARYYSFLPWCIYNFSQHEKGKPYAQTLRAAIKERETALTLGSVINHDGSTCEGGALVGSEKASAWFISGNSEANLKTIELAKNPALDAYSNSLMNLGFFVTDEERASTGELDDEESFTFDDIELSPLGLKMAESYDAVVKKTELAQRFSKVDRKCSKEELGEWGTRGCLCEVKNAASEDRGQLRNVFFAKTTPKKNKSHYVRNRSLVLILYFCDELAKKDWELDEPTFGMATYYGGIVTKEGERMDVVWPESLVDIVDRWRMYYFHHHMSTALEGMFAWLVTEAFSRGVSGVSVEELVEFLNSEAVDSDLSTIFDTEIPQKFCESAPGDFLALFGVDTKTADKSLGESIDANIDVASVIAEHRLEEAIRKRTYLYSPSGLAVPLVLLNLTLARFCRWENSEKGNWLANVAKDPYVDLLPPVLLRGLREKFKDKFKDWLGVSWKDNAAFVLSRYVVEQHRSMAYEKTSSGDRCLLQLDGQKIVADFEYEKVGLGNPRFASAVRILKDLGLLEKSDKDGVTYLTDDGKEWLKNELTERTE